MATSPIIGLRPILALAIPSAAFTILTNGYRVVDQYFSQGISVDAQAAVGSSTFVLIFFYAAFELLAAGAGPLIARATGAGDTVARRALLGEALFGALLLTGVLMIVGIVGAPLIATALGLIRTTGDRMYPVPAHAVLDPTAAGAYPTYRSILHQHGQCPYANDPACAFTEPQRDPYTDPDP